MGKSHSKKVKPSVEFIELINNGLVLNNVEIPPELIENILFCVDVKSLLKCRRVCKYWNEIISNHILRKMAEKKLNCKFTADTMLGWEEFYSMCCGIFGKNLVKNHSGQEKFEHWQNIGSNCWAIECPPNGAPLLPEQSQCENDQRCFVTSNGITYKCYVVDLIKEGFTANILDNLQPTIEISEIYCCRFDCPAAYNICVDLLNQSDEKLDEFLFEDTLVGDRQNIWLNVKHEFKNYGKGLRKIQFIHGGSDPLFWPLFKASHYGPKMARARIEVKVPSPAQWDSFKRKNK